MNDNLFPQGGFDPSKVRLRPRKPYLKWVGSIAECDAHHLVGEQLLPYQAMPTVAARLGLAVVEEDLGPLPTGAAAGYWTCQNTR